MKRYLHTFSLLTLFVLMLAFPKLVFTGAAEGLLLWFHTVLPTLFPFMVVTGLLLGSSTVDTVSQILHPLTGPLFHISPKSSLAVLAGFLCGYPMGAKMASDLVRRREISKQEGEYLISFCNNTSPMFVISYLFMQTLKRQDLALISLGILYGSSVLCSTIFRRFHNRKNTIIPATETVACGDETGNFLELLDICISESCDKITRIGGYIIVCSILLSLLREIPSECFWWNNILLPSIEITAGIQMINSGKLIFPIRYILMMALTAFGGFSAILQTKCMTSNTGFSISMYTLEKLITASVTSLFAFIYMKFYY